MHELLIICELLAGILAQGLVLSLELLASVVFWPTLTFKGGDCQGFSFWCIYFVHVDLCMSEPCIVVALFSTARAELYGSCFIFDTST